MYKFNITLFLTDVQPQTKDNRVPWRKTEENEEMRRLRRQRSKQQLETQQSLCSITEEEKRKLPDIQITSDNRERSITRDRADKVEIDSDNIETPPVQRKYFNPPPEREPCRKFQPSFTNRFNVQNDKAAAEMKDLCQEILGDGQFDRFSAARRTRRYKRPTDSSSPEEEQVKKSDSPTELIAETQVIRPTKLEIQASYPIDTPQEVAKSIENVTKDEKEDRLKRWQDRLKTQTPEIKSPTTSTKEITKPTTGSYSRMRRQTSINQEDVQKAIRELKSPTETPTGVWSRNAYRRSLNTHNRSSSENRPPTQNEKTTSSRITKVKSEHELNDEGFEETQSLNSESASQGASSGCNVECDSPTPNPQTKPSKSPDIPKRTTTKESRAPPRTPVDNKRIAAITPNRNNSLRVERSTSRASLRSSRSSLNSSVSVSTVKKAPPAPKPTPKAIPTKSLQSRMPASRSSSSGSSIGTSRPPVKSISRTSGFMRPTQASKGRGNGTPVQPNLRTSVK